MADEEAGASAAEIEGEETMVLVEEAVAAADVAAVEETDEATPTTTMERLWQLQWRQRQPRV